MTIRKIKANKAQEEGDYIRIELYSTRPICMVLGALIGFFLGLLLSESNNEITLTILSTIALAFIGALCGHGKEVRRVPKADLVEIKQYSSGHVTVVLDDERVKREPREYTYEK